MSRNSQGHPTLDRLQGEWRLDSLEVDGAAMPAAMLSHTRILFDGDRFLTESPEANYDGVFTINLNSRPPQIDIAFVEGPEAGNTCYGIYELDGDSLTLCLGLAGAPRPVAFVTARGSGHALERLYRVSADRPANVTGGTPPPKPPASPAAREDPSGFDVPITAFLRRMEGEWIPVQLVSDGKPMPDQWLSFGSRTMVGNEMKVVFGGQVMVHAKVRADDTTTPVAIDYLNLDGKRAGTVSRGIMEWNGDELRILMPPAGQPRPADFSVTLAKGTFSQWRRRG